MKLIVPNPIVSADKVSCASLQFRIPPLPFMKGCSNIIRIIDTGRDFKISGRFYELFGPINRNSNTERDQCIFPKQSMEYKDVYTQGKISKRKEMPPHKLQRFLSFTPYWLYRIHGLYPLIYYQISTPFIKNTPQFNSMNEMDYAHAFQKRASFQEGNTYDFT
jgi:hypothetical protein